MPVVFVSGYRFSDEGRDFESPIQRLDHRTPVFLVIRSPHFLFPRGFDSLRNSPLAILD